MKRNKPPRSHWYLAPLIIGGFIFVAVILYFMFSQSGSVNVSLEFSKPDRIFTGQPFAVEVSLNNYSDKILQGATLSLSLPDGVSFAGQSSGQRVLEQSVGDLGPGGLSKQTFTLIATGGNQTQKHIQATLTYAIANHRYNSDAAVDVLIGQPAVALNMTAPQSVISGSAFSVTVNVQNNTGQPYDNLHLHFDYAPIFQFKSSDVAPTNGVNDWDVGSLAPGVSKNITITGSAVGAEQSNFQFIATLSANVAGQTYDINKNQIGLNISAAPLSISITVNNTANYVSRLSDPLTYVLTYKNSSEFTMQNVVIRAQLTGEMFDLSMPDSRSSFNSVVNTFTWLTANTPDLASIAPGEEGTVEVTVRTKDAFPIRRLSDKNYTLKIQAQIESPTVPSNTSQAKTISVASLETRITGELAIAAKGYWRDAASGILNSGLFPPHVNQATQYTVHWLVANYATDATNVQVSAFLQSGAHCTGVVKSNWSTSPVCDSNTGSVTWAVGNVPATKGITSPPIEAIFQVEQTPATNQVGQVLAILGETSVRGQDAFTSSTLSGTAEPVTTQLPDDTTLSQSDHQVQQ